MCWEINVSSVFLSIDSGTSSIRVSFFSEEIVLIASESIERSVNRKFSAEQEWDYTRKLIRRIIEKNPGYKIKAIAVSQFLSWVMIDKDGNPLSDVIMYTDQNLKEYTEYLSKNPLLDFYKKTGRDISADMPIFELIRIKNENRRMYDKIYKMIPVKDYINFKLTGEIFSDYTFSCYGSVFNIITKDYDDEILLSFNIEKDKFPELRKCNSIIGMVNGKVASDIGLAEEIPVAAGGPDGSIGIIGIGNTKKTSAVSIMGTTDVFFANSDSCLIKKIGKELVKNIHPLEDNYLLGGPMGFSGGTINWLIKFLNGQYSLENLNEIAEDIPLGSGGVMFIPGLTGERAPFWNPKIKGSIIGLQPYHNAGHMFRAILEANSFTTLKIIEIIRCQGADVNNIITGGGGSRSNLWMQIKADITGIPVMVSSEKETTSKGNAIIASLAVNNRSVIPEPQIRHVFYPDKEVHEKYHESYNLYLKFIKLINEIY